MPLFYDFAATLSMANIYLYNLEIIAFRGFGFLCLPVGFVVNVRLGFLLLLSTSCGTLFF